MSACLGGEIPKALEVDDWELARKLAGEYGGHPGQGPVLPGAAGPRDPGAAPPQRAAPPPRPGDRPAAGRHQRPALRAPGAARGARRPAVRRHREQPRHAEPDALRGHGLLPQDRGRDVPRSSRTSARRTSTPGASPRWWTSSCPLGELRIPHFPVPDGETVESWLRKECEAGLVRRYGAITPELQARLDYELGVIISMGYAGYFLIVADFVRFAREQGIATTCRGSAPGSIVTYTLGITPVDPLHYGLPVRALPQPGPRDDARHRRGLRGRAPGRGHQLRQPQVRPRTTSPRSSPSARCSPARRSATWAA